MQGHKALFYDVSVDFLLCFCRFFGLDSAFALSEWQNEGKRGETRLIPFGFPSGGGLRTFCYLVVRATPRPRGHGWGEQLKHTGQKGDPEGRHGSVHELIFC